MKTMQLLVTDLLRRGTKTTRTLDVDPDDTIYSVMEQIEDATGFPPIVQMMELTFGCKVFFYDSPGGTLADHKLVPSSPDMPPVSVTVKHSGLTWTRLRAKTLRNMGLLAGADEEEEELDPSSELQLASYPGQEKMLITVRDYTRVARGPELLALVVEAGDTVLSLKEQVRRRRRYPVAMQNILVSDADNPDMERRMDKLDATLADYKVKKDSLIKLYMNMAFAVEVDREERGKPKLFKAKEIAGPGEQEQVSNSSSPTTMTKSKPPAGSVYHAVFCLFTGAAVVIGFIAMVASYYYLI